MKIKVLDGYTLNPGDLSWEMIEQFGELTVYPRTSPNEILEHAAEADILLTNKVPLTADTIEKLPQLKYIGVLATGYNIVDTEAASRKGIPVCNIPAYSTQSVAQMVFAHILAITNRVEHYTQENRNGKWSNNTDFCYWDTPLNELYGKTMGIVGLGHIGKSVAQIANAFGMNVCAFTSKSAEDCQKMQIAKKGLNELFSESDIITLHCPLTPDTRQIINTESLSVMKHSAILINTGRGPCRPLETDEAQRHPHQHRTRSAGQRTRPCRCTEQRNHLCRRTGCALTGTSPCRQPAAHRPELLHHPAYRMGY